LNNKLFKREVLFFRAKSVARIYYGKTNKASGLIEKMVIKMMNRYYSNYLM